MPGSGHPLVPSRRIPVLVGTLPIEDGQTPPPVVGEIGHYPLVFSEARADVTDETDATVVDVRARAEPHSGPPRRGGWRGNDVERLPVWPTILHGDGWSANWSAPRPVIGRVRLRGTLVGDLGISSRQWVRGRILSARVVTETIDTTAADQLEWRPIPGAQRLRPVETAPRWFDEGMEPAPLPPGVTEGWVPAVRRDPYTVETGVLVELDLDDVPPLPPRPSIVPAAVSASGEHLWVLDAQLPLAVRVSVTSRHATSYPWPGAILTERFVPRRVHADPDGCWITGPDGVRRVDLASGTVRSILDEPVDSAVAVDGALVVLENGRARWFRPDGEGGDDVVETPLPPLAGPPATDGDGGLVLVLAPPDGERRLARLHADGTLVEAPPGPVLAWPNATLCGGPPVFVTTSGRSGHNQHLHPVLGDLGLGPAVENAVETVLYPLMAGGRAFMCGQTDQPERRPLLTEIDPATGDVVAATVVDALPADHLTIDGQGTVWWPSRSGVSSLSPGGAVEPLDVAALLDGAGPSG